MIWYSLKLSRTDAPIGISQNAASPISHGDRKRYAARCSLRAIEPLRLLVGSTGAAVAVLSAAPPSLPSPQAATPASDAERVPPRERRDAFARSSLRPVLPGLPLLVEVLLDRGGRVVQGLL